MALDFSKLQQQMMSKSRHKILREKDIWFRILCTTRHSSPPNVTYALPIHDTTR